MSHIHPSAIIEDGASLGDGVRIGPFCHVGKDVVLGDGVELKSHVTVAGSTRIGARTVIFPFASIGHQAQDLKFKGEHATLSVGEDCIIREGVTMNAGTEGAVPPPPSVTVVLSLRTLMLAMTAIWAMAACCRTM